MDIIHIQPAGARRSHGGILRRHADPKMKRGAQYSTEPIREGC